MKLREATINDLNNGLLKVFIEGYRYHQKGRNDIFANLSDEDLKEDLIKQFENLSILVIIDNDIIIGYLAYKIKEKHVKKLDVDQLIITEKYRRKGLGKALMNEAKDIALKNNCDRIELNCWTFNEEAITMYEHIGFERQRIVYEMPLKNIQ